MAMANYGQYLELVEKKYDEMKKIYFMAISHGEIIALIRLALYFQKIEKNLKEKISKNDSCNDYLDLSLSLNTFSNFSNSSSDIFSIIFLNNSTNNESISSVCVYPGVNIDTIHICVAVEKTQIFLL